MGDLVFWIVAAAIALALVVLPPVLWTARNKRLTQGTRAQYRGVATSRGGEYFDEPPPDVRAALSGTLLEQTTEQTSFGMALPIAGNTAFAFERIYRVRHDKWFTSTYAQSAFAIAVFDQTIPDFLWRPGQPNDTSGLAQFLGTAVAERDLEPMVIKSHSSRFRLFGRKSETRDLLRILNPGVLSLLTAHDVVIEASDSMLFAYTRGEWLVPGESEFDEWVSFLQELLNRMNLAAS